MGPVGTYNFTVYNNAKGLAQMNAVTNSFTFPLVTTSITPTYGGVGGILILIFNILSLFYLN